MTIYKKTFSRRRKTMVDLMQETEFIKVGTDSRTKQTL